MELNEHQIGTVWDIETVGNGPYLLGTYIREYEIGLPPVGYIRYLDHSSGFENEVLKDSVAIKIVDFTEEDELGEVSNTVLADWDERGTVIQAKVKVRVHRTREFLDASAGMGGEPLWDVGTAICQYFEGPQHDDVAVLEDWSVEYEEPDPAELAFELSNAIWRMNRDWETGKACSPDTWDFVREGCRLLGLPHDDRQEYENLCERVYEMDCEVGLNRDSMAWMIIDELSRRAR